MSAGRPPAGDDEDQQPTPGEPPADLPPESPPVAPEPDLQPAAPPLPWERVEPTTRPAQSSWRPYPEDEEPVLQPEPEPALVPDPQPREPRTGSIAPPGHEGSGGATAIPPGATVPPRTPRAPEAPLPGARPVLAEWWRRVVAFVIDGIVIGVAVAIIIVLITAAAGGVGFLGGDTTGYGSIVVGLLFSTLIATGVAVLYAPAYMARTNGQTLGKQLLGIRVIRANGKPVDLLWSLLREVVVKTLVFAGVGSSFTFGLAWLLDALWPLWDDEHRALHDMIVDSRVVRA